MFEAHRARHRGDLAARSRAVPVYAMLGGASSGLIPVCALLASRTPGALVREALVARAHGYAVFELKVGAGAIADDLEAVNALRDAIGETGLIRLDANRAWNFEQALSALSRLGPGRIEFVEEPLQSCSPVELARLRDATGIAVALDESIGCAGDLEPFCEVCGSGLVVVLKAARAGGPSKCLKIAATAEASGVAKIVVTDSVESPVGMSAAVHLAAALAPAGTAVGLAGARFLARGSSDAAELREAPWVQPCGPGLSCSVQRSG